MTSETKFRIALALLLVCFVLLFVKNVVGKEVIALDVMPKFFVCLPNGKPTMGIRVTIERHADNRHLSIAWGSEEGTSGVSFVQLDGDKAPAVFTIYREVSCASYAIEACVYQMKKKSCARGYVTKGGG